MRVLTATCLGIVIVVSGLVCVSVAAEDAPEWLTPEFGPVSPSLHINASVGDSSGDPESLALGHHDPTREDGTVQGIEAGVSFRLKYLHGFATHNFTYGAEEEWDNGWEEAFLKLVELPGGLEVRGGRMLARFGQHNADHLHAWSFVDMPLALGSFLGDDGLIFDGGDITWLKQDVATTFGLTVGFGEAMAHEHDHGDHDHDEHGEHEEDEEHGDHEGEEEHGEHDEDDHDEHEEAPGFADDVYSGRAFGIWRRDDFNSCEAGLSVAVGDDESERQLAVYGVDFSYTWREKGLEAGGRAITWQTELLFRNTEDGEEHEHDEHEEEHDEHEHEDEDDEHEEMHGGSEFGIYSQVVYSHNENWDFATRVGYLAGDEDVHTHDRVRVSPAATWWIYPQHASLRLQYNYDDLEDGDEEHSVWLQLGLSLGGGEVR